MSRKVYGAPLGAAALAFASSLASAQQSLPTINVGGSQSRPTGSAAARSRGAVVAAAPSAALSVSTQPTSDESSFAPPRRVESPKFTLPLLDTPQSVTVIPKVIMQETGSRSLSEVLRYTPGVTIDAGENAFTASNNFRIRGFNATGDIYIDNSRDNGNYSRDMFNTERVEVFKGVAADNGRGSAGGYVNLVTKTPKPTNFVSGEAWYGWDHYNSVPRRRGTVDVNYLVAPNTAVRLNALVENSEVPGREIALARPWGIAPSISFGLDTNMRATLFYEHQERRDLPDWGIPAASVGNMVRSDPIAMMARRDTFYGLRSDYDNVDADSAQLRLAYDIQPDITVSNQTRWSQVRRSANYHLPGAPFGGTPPAYIPGTGIVTTQAQAYDRLNSTLTNLTNLTAKFETGAFKHDVSTGIDYSLERSFSHRFDETQGETFIFNPNPDRFQEPTPPRGTNKLEVETIAGYAYDSIHLHPQWILTGGVRLEHYRLKIGMKDLAGLPMGQFDGYTDSPTTVGGKAAMVYKPVESASLYGGVGWSNEPVGANFLTSPDISRGDDRSLVTLVRNSQPIRMVNYEIGSKWELFEGRLLTTLALFHTVKTVPITGCFGNPPGLPGAGCIGGAAQPITLKGYGDQVAEGIEFGVAGNVTENWQMFGGFLIMRSERQHGFWLDWFRMAASPGDYPVFTPGVDAPAAFFSGFYRRGTNGDQLAFAPNVTGNLWTTYRLPETPITVGGGLIYSSSSFAGRQDYGERIVPNGRFGMLPSYFIVNLMTSFELYKDVSLTLNVDNVANRKFAAATNNAAQRVVLGTPRAFRFALNFRY